MIGSFVSITNVSVVVNPASSVTTTTYSPSWNEYLLSSVNVTSSPFTVTIIAVASLNVSSNSLSKYFLITFPLASVSVAFGFSSPLIVGADLSIVNVTVSVFPAASTATIV